ncbi:MAG: hypothetical protein RIT45_3411 [Pseudomonadota bacterium]
MTRAEPIAAACGVLVAGGHGRRAGGPKALKRLDGALLWRVHAEALHAAGCARVVAVLHPAAMPDAAATDPPTPWLRCVGADPDAPMFASLQRGLATLAADEAAVVQLVDAGLAAPATVAALRTGATEAAEVWVVRPRHGARTGHPLWLAPAAVARLTTLDASSTRLDHWLAALPPARRLDVAVEDAGVLANFNADGIGAGEPSP